MPEGKEWHESLFSSRRGYICVAQAV